MNSLTFNGKSSDLSHLMNCSPSEYDLTTPPKLSERVLKDKRKKLKETFDRVMGMYVSITFR